MSIHLNRTKNTLNNIAFGFIHKTIALLFPFITRTVLIYHLGTEYLGLSSVFSSVLQVLNLAEFGFGNAIVFCLYRPIAEQNNDLVCLYLEMLRKVYRYIGLIIMAVGVLLIPVLPFFIKNQILPDGSNLYICYSFFLFDSSISYLLYGYKVVLPQAMQRLDLLNKIDIGIVAGKSLFQIGVILAFKSYYVFLLIAPVFTIVRNLMISWLIDQRYPQYKPSGVLPANRRKELLTIVKGIAIGKICIASRNGIDGICLSAFLGLKVAAIYNNYYYLMNAVVAVSMIFCTSVMSGVGNSIVTESKEKNYTVMKRLEFVYMTMAGWASICLLCLYQPFMKLWMGNERMLGMPEVILFVIYFYLLKMGDLRWIYQECAGLWWDCRHVTLVETIVNLVLNIILGKKYGVFGILLATDVSMLLINFFGSAKIVFFRYFGRNNQKEYFISHLQYFLINAIIMLVTYISSSSMIEWLCIESFIFRVLVYTITCLLIPATLYWLVYRKTEKLVYWIKWLKTQKFHVGKIKLY